MHLPTLPLALLIFSLAVAAQPVQTGTEEPTPAITPATTGAPARRDAAWGTVLSFTTTPSIKSVLAKAKGEHGYY